MDIDDHDFDLNVGYETEQSANESFGEYGDNFNHGDDQLLMNEDEAGEEDQGENDQAIDLNDEPDENNDSVQVVEGGDVDEEQEGYVHIEPPATGMVFTHSKEILDYIHAYARAVGFQYMIRSSVKPTDPNPLDNYKRLRLACSKYGKFSSKSKKSKRGSTSCVTGCKFGVNAAVHKDGRWVVAGVNLEHNHECEPKHSKLLPNYRVISERNKTRILNSDRAGVPIAKNFGTFVVEHGSHVAVPFSNKDCRNLITKDRRRCMEKGDFLAMQAHFDDMSKDVNSNFFYSYELDDDGRLGNVFWADGRSRAAYAEFGDVICFDTTYVSNRYKMPFAPFIGINNHGQSVLFGCALLGHEETGNFVWLFRTWLTCMSGKEPKAIITDQCRSIGASLHPLFIPNFEIIQHEFVYI